MKNANRIAKVWLLGAAVVLLLAQGAFAHEGFGSSYAPSRAYYGSSGYPYGHYRPMPLRPPAPAYCAPTYYGRPTYNHPQVYQPPVYRPCAPSRYVRPSGASFGITIYLSW